MFLLFNFREDFIEFWVIFVYKKQQVVNLLMYQQIFWFRNFISIIFFICRILLNYNYKKFQGKIFIFVQYFFLVLIFFYRKYKLDIKESRRLLSKMRMVIEVCKYILFILENVQVFIDLLYEGVDFYSSVFRQVEFFIK